MANVLSRAAIGVVSDYTRLRVPRIAWMLLCTSVVFPDNLVDDPTPHCTALTTSLSLSLSLPFSLSFSLSLSLSLSFSLSADIHLVNLSV